METNGEGESGKSMLTARHDDDDEYIYIYIHTHAWLQLLVPMKCQYII